MLSGRLRISLPWGAGLALLLVCGLSGCGEKTDATGQTGATGDSTAATSGDGTGHSTKSPRPPKPLLKDWPKPAVALVLSGEQHGYLEPCGCSETQSGGVSRRADLFRQLREDRKWPVTALDLGGTIKRNRLQSRFKFDAILASLKDMGYVGLGLGPEEIRFGVDDLLQKHTFATDPENPDSSLPFLAANVVFFDAPDLGTPAHTRVVSQGDVKIGVTSILGEGMGKSLFPGGANADVTIKPPAEVLPKALEKLKTDEPDLLVLLSHASIEESKKLAEQFPDFDIVLTAGGPEDPDPKPQYVGDTLFLQVGHKGKYVGVVGFYPQDEKQRLRYELVDLDNQRFEDTPAMREHMRFYQDLLRINRDAIFADLPKASAPSKSGSTFVGAAKCGECHTKAYAKWKTSKHAHAYESLSRGRKGQEANWISRVNDTECLSCHVTGWHPQNVVRYDSGFLSEEATPHLVGQQCENCHGPGTRHAEVEANWKADRKSFDDDTRAERLDLQKEIRITLDVAKNRVCYSCHDNDNSPHFQFEKYWEEIRHPWKD